MEYGSLLHWLGWGTCDFDASRAWLKVCQAGPVVGAYGCIPSKYLTMDAAPMAPLTALSHGVCRLTSVPITGSSPFSCSSSDRKVAPVCGSTSVKITWGWAARMLSTSLRYELWSSAKGLL